MTLFPQAATNILSICSQNFIVHFDQYTEIAGYAKVKLWMSCAEHDDMDVVVQLQKVDKSGRPLVQVNYPVPDTVQKLAHNSHVKTFGPRGFLRASHTISKDDPQTSPDGQEIYYGHNKQEVIEPGTIVQLEITFTPMGMVFGPGEGLRLRIAGHDLDPEVVPITEPIDFNKGVHHIHTGGIKYDSNFNLPIISQERP